MQYSFSDPRTPLHGPPVKNLCSKLTFDSVISAPLNVEGHQIESSGAGSCFKEVVREVVHEAAIPKIAVLAGETGNKLVQDSRSRRQFFRLKYFTSNYFRIDLLV